MAQSFCTASCSTPALRMNTGLYAAPIRFIDAFGFLGRVASRPDWAKAEVAMVRQMMDSVKLQAGYPANPVDPARPRQR